MFSGIVSAIGRVKHSAALAQGVQLTVGAGGLDLADVQPGDSIAVNGVCLTVVRLSPGEFVVDMSQETLACTTGFANGARVNLEKALRLADRLGGHLVSGHVDGVGEVTHFCTASESMLLAIRAPHALARYIARKGSIAVNGVSLTINRVAGAEFEINLIPHTLQMTTLNELQPGDHVNLEVDMIARYVERMLHPDE
ncbi:MAG: riboflavin synthase [Pseudomonadota bacterium]